MIEKRETCSGNNTIMTKNQADLVRFRKKCEPRVDIRHAVYSESKLFAEQQEGNLVCISTTSTL